MKKLKRIFALITLIILVSITLNIYPTKAVTTTLSASSVTVQSGEEFSVSITSSIKLSGWTISLTSTGGCTFLSASGVEVNGQSVYGTNNAGETSLATYNFKAPSVTEDKTYTISFSGSEMCDSSDEAADVSPTNCSATITVKAPVQPPTTQTGPGPVDQGSPTPQPGENTNTVPQDNPTPQEPEKSKICNLSSLKVNDGQRELDLKQTKNPSAGFNRDVEDYTIVFPEDYNFEELTTVKLVATAEDSKATISGTGDKTVNEGDNTFEVSCTAENGKVKTYRIKITKPVMIKKSELKLDTLVIDKINEKGEQERLELDKEFNAETQEYNAEVASDIEKLSIKLLTSKVKDQDIIVRINGEEVKRDIDGKLEAVEYKLEDGKNTIRITLVSPTDENVTTDYVVTINREAKVVATTEESKGFSINPEDIPKIVIGVILGIILLLVLILVILLIINNKQKKKEGQAVVEDSDKDESEDNEDEKFDESYLSDKNLERLNKEYSSKVEENEEEPVKEETKQEEEVKVEPEKEPEEVVKGDYGTADEIEMLEKNIKALEEENLLKGNKPEGEKDYEEELENKEKNYENESEESRKKRLEELVGEIKSKQKGKNTGKHSK